MIKKEDYIEHNLEGQFKYDPNWWTEMYMGMLVFIVCLAWFLAPPRLSGGQKYGHGGGGNAKCFPRRPPYLIFPCSPTRIHRTPTFSSIITSLFDHQSHTQLHCTAAAALVASNAADMDAVHAILEKAAEYLVAPIGRELGYVFHYQSNIKDLKSWFAKLGDERHRLQRSVDAAIRNGEVIEKDVEKRLSSAESIMVDVTGLLAVEVQGNNSFLREWCLNLAGRYQVGKKVRQMVLAISELCENSKFNSISHAAPPPQIFSSNTNYEAFESRIPVIKGILEAVKDDKIAIIGVYGMAGVGKTILVKEIGRQAKDHKLFNTVVMATVSQTPSLKDIQGELAEMLGLKLVAESTVMRAGHLRERLLTEKQILIILDDIWSRLDLEKVGIPHGRDHEGLKIILTSRSLDTCIEMDTQRDFLVEVLSEWEAWELFKKMVGIVADAPGVLPLAVEITKECAGLPIAIVTVARSLKNRSTFVWKDALHQLRACVPSNISGLHSKVLSSVELSYNYLQNEETKTFFLLCCLFPEDSDIAIEELLHYGIGLELFQNTDTLEAARVRALTIAHTLKSACLLLEGSSIYFVKMHDVVRDVALSIASEGKHTFLVRIGDGLKRWPKKDVCEQHTAISIFSSEINELPHGLLCPKLQILALECSNPSLEISGTFFTGFMDLRVLDLSCMHILSLPQSLCSLKNIRTLRLDCCQLSNIAMIGELKTLEVLSLQSSDIRELPVEIGQLVYLKLLDLTGCKNLKVIPPNVIASLSELEELYLLDSFDEWEVIREVSIKERTAASLTELKELSCLTVLEIHIPNISLLPSDLLFSTLSRYKISLGSCFWKKEFSHSRTMQLENKEGASLGGGISFLLNNVEDLRLSNMKSLVEVVRGINRDGFLNLKCLEIGNCYDLEHLVNTVEFSPPQVFPALECLKLSHLDSMSELSHGDLMLGSFGSLRKLWLASLPALQTLWKGSDRFLCLQNLRIVRIKHCSSLEYLFSLSVAEGLGQLLILDIASCDTLKEVLAEDRDRQERTIVVIVLPQLRFLKLQHLCQLGSFGPERNPLASEYNVQSQIGHPLFNFKVAFPNLEELEVKKLNNLQQIWSHSQVGESFCDLKTLRVSGCDKLLNAVPHYSISMLINLEELYVGECNSLKDVFDIQSLVIEENRELPLSSLKKLKLQNLPKLTQIWSRNPIGSIGVENLNSLEICRCHGLHSLMTPSMARAFVHLKLLHIDSCTMMEDIVSAENEEEVNAANEIIFPQLKHLKLLYLSNLRSFSSGISTLSFPSLEELILVDCDKMKSFVYQLSSTANLENYQGNLDGYCLFTEKVSFPNLSKLKLERIQTTEIWHLQLEAESFFRLKVLLVEHCDKLKRLFASKFLRRLQNLEQLTVSRCQSLDTLLEADELVASEGETVLPLLKELRLWALPNVALRTIYQGLLQEGRTGQCLFNRGKMITCPSLEVLRIEDLHSLNVIWHGQLQAVIFSHLRYLAVRNCHKLQHLVPSYLLKKLYNLRKLVVENCDSLEEVITDLKGEKGIDELVFRHLATIELGGLSRLKSFCSSSFPLECPFLNKVEVKDCPKMQTFSFGIVSAPLLQKISVGKDYDLWMDNLNNTIEHLFQRNSASSRSAASGIGGNNIDFPSTSNEQKRRRISRGEKKGRGFRCQGIEPSGQVHTCGFGKGRSSSVVRKYNLKQA